LFSAGGETFDEMCRLLKPLHFSKTAQKTLLLTVRLRVSDGASDKPIGRHPRRIPSLHCGTAYQAFEAADLTTGSHGFGPAIDCAALAVAMRL
jgi:hypothetical protein